MRPDGADAWCSSREAVSEFCPVILDDGRVMYHRWEYIDKGARVAKTVWTMNPDGTPPRNCLAWPSTTIYMYPQPIPGAEHRFVCVGTCHYPQGLCLGPILLVDYGKGVRVRGAGPGRTGLRSRRPAAHPVAGITPEVFIERGRRRGGTSKRSRAAMSMTRKAMRGHLYTHPYPVGERQFLVSCKVDPAAHYKEVANAYALCLIDTEASGAVTAPMPNSPAGIPAAGRAAGPAAAATRPQSGTCRRQPGSARWPMSTREWKGSSRER